VVGCNIPVFVYLEKPSISSGLYDQDSRFGMHARMYIVSIQQLIATKGVDSSYTMDISSSFISFFPLRERGIP
jgi:hypothetical protein